MKQKVQYKPISNILDGRKYQLAKLTAKISQLSQFNQCLYRILEPKFSQHCQVADLQDNCLVIAVDNAEWATNLRYLIPDMLPKLQKSTKIFRNLQSIRCIIIPQHKPKRIKPHLPSPLSVASCKVIKSAATGMPDGALKDALQRLSKQ